MSTTARRPAPTQADIDKAYEKLRRAERERDALRERVASLKRRATAAARDAQRWQGRAEAERRRGLLLAELVGPEYGIARDVVVMAAGLLEGVRWARDGSPLGVAEAVERLLAERPSMRDRQTGGTR